MATEAEGEPASPDHDRSRNTIDSMIDDPVAHAVRFALGCVVTWSRALFTPMRVAARIARGDAGLPPPFAWLVAMLFSAGVSLRVFFAMEAVPSAAESRFADELRRALGDVSLTNAVMVTLPCVLLVACGGRLASWLLGAAPVLPRDAVVRAMCYAAGWQAGLVAIAFTAPTIMQLGGMEPTGRWNREFNLALVSIVVGGVLWGALLLTPAVAARLRLRLPLAPVFGGAFALVVSGPIAAGWLALLGQSVDLRAAAQIADARQQRDWFGELDIDVLQTRPAALGAQRGQTTMTVAYTSRSDRLLVVPYQPSFTLKDGDRRLMVVESSLDFLPDRALLIAPGATRVAEYTVRSADGGPTPAGIGPNAALVVPHHRREDDGGFTKGLAEMWAPRALWGQSNVAGAERGRVR